MNCDSRNLRSEMINISDGIGMKKSQVNYICLRFFHYFTKKVAHKLQLWFKIMPLAKRHDRDR